jgi:hypothetical protein
MITALLYVLRLCPFLFGGHRQFALRTLPSASDSPSTSARSSARLRPTDRLFWVALARGWTGWRRALVIVAPDTVVRWQRRRFRAYWTKLSGSHPVGRPTVSPQIAALVARMAAANPLWDPRESIASSRSSASSSRSARSPD